jgi:hypothetical protein
LRRLELNSKGSFCLPKYEDKSKCGTESDNKESFRLVDFFEKLLEEKKENKLCMS